jgi:hypothetical protein
LSRFRILVAIVAWIAGVATQAAPLSDNTVRLAPSQLKLPQNIGPLRYTGENRFRDRRLGRSFGFNASGISLSIYVYDYGVRDVPDGADSVPLCEQYESAKQEIERGGNYENVTLKAEVSRRLLPGSDDSPIAREALYEFDRRGVHALSALWLTAIDGYFVKLRLSLRSEVADELDEARTQILEAIADAIANRRKREMRPSRPPAQDASIEVDGHHDPEAAALWFTYAAHLVTFSREYPERRPACGGQLVPGFIGELAARRAALAEYRSRAPAGIASGYFDELARVDGAGLLEEYVWHYLRDEELDRVPPLELQMGAFEEYRERELADHVVQSGARVRINTVRVLPPAPDPRPDAR